MIHYQTFLSIYVISTLNHYVTSIIIIKKRLSKCGVVKFAVTLFGTMFLSKQSKPKIRDIKTSDTFTRKFPQVFFFHRDNNRRQTEC